MTAGLGRLSLVDLGLLTQIIAEISVPGVPLEITSVKTYADRIGFPGGYDNLDAAIKRLTYLRYVDFDDETRTVTIGPRTYGDPVELPWQLGHTTRYETQYPSESPLDRQLPYTAARQ